MDRDEVEVHKNAKRERVQYPAMLTELAWSIKNLLCGIKSAEKMIFVLVYFRALKRKPVRCLSDGACSYIRIGYMQKIQSFDWLHFKFKVSNFQIQNKLSCLPVFVASRIFKTHQYFCFLCFHSRFLVS